MNMSLDKIGALSMAFAITMFVAAGCGTTMAKSGDGIKVTLTGDQEVPPVKTSASGNGTIVVSADKSVSGSVTTSGVQATAAHIHVGARGQNGPIIVPLTKTSENTWSVPAGAKFTDDQYASYLAGNLYVNVHSAANKGGEIRGQLNPK